MKHKVAVVLGIRPDFIRTSQVLKLLRDHPKVDLSLIHTGQHYNENLNQVFFDQLQIPGITHQLDTKGRNHNHQHAKLIGQLSDTLEDIRPDVCLFLGDANATIGCIAPLKLGIPIAHIEAGMRSYDWVMPEERNRVIIDRVSDVLYVYQQDYRLQLIHEGIDPTKIVVTGNVIVDIINEYFEHTYWKGFDGTENTRKKIGAKWVAPHEYALMTLHRNEHMLNPTLAQDIINGVEEAMMELRPDDPVLLIEMPRLKALQLNYPSRFILLPPQGFFEFLELEANAGIEFTDSGTNQEVASVLGTPCVVTRRCTERPECNDCGTTVLAQPPLIGRAARHILNAKFRRDFSLGDGNSSKRIVTDLVHRLDHSWSPDLPWVDKFKKKHFEGFHEWR